MSARPRARTLLLAAGLSAAGLMCACGGDHDDGGPAAAAASSTANEFTVRGVVVSPVADGDDGVRTIALKNEAVPEHPPTDGAPGLDPTERTYALAEELEPTSLIAGDPVEFRFQIDRDDMSPTPTLLEIALLDDDVELDFSCLPRVYSTRGVVTQLPGPMADFNVHHEPIPDFVSGDERGMPEMIMHFPLGGNTALLDGVEVGDKVAIDLVVEYKADHRLHNSYVTSIDVLPEDAQLNLSGRR